MSIPNNGLAIEGAAMLRIISTIDKTQILEQGVSLAADSGMYYDVEIELPAGLKNGEYEYILEQSGTISNGLLQIGEIARATKAAEGTISFNQL